MDLDEVIGELFHLQDYGMGERPVKLCIYGADGHQLADGMDHNRRTAASAWF